MKLKVSDLKRFFALSNAIVSRNTLNIYNFIKLEGGRLIKTDGKTFISHVIDAPQDVSILLEIATLNALVKTTRSSEITVEVKKKAIRLSDDEGFQEFQTPAVKEFFAFPNSEKGEAVYELDYDAVEAIGISAKNTSNIGGNANFDFVHLTKGFVFGTDRDKIYSKRIKGLPDATFDVACANTISQFDSLTYYVNGTYNFFETGNTLYGFQQYADVKTPDITNFLKVNTDADFFEFDVNDFIRFCEFVIAQAPVGLALIDCNMKGGELWWADAKYGKEVNRKMPFKGNFEPEILFNPKFVMPYLKSLGKETVKFYPFKKGMVYVCDDADPLFVGMISGMQSLKQ